MDSTYRNFERIELLQFGESQNMKDQVVETGRVFAHPWLCDVMGHMNARHIFGALDDAGFHLLSHIGWCFNSDAAKQFGWADVKVEVQFRSEISVGTAMVTKSTISELGKSSMTQKHTLLSIDETTLYADSTAKTVFFDLKKRSSASLPEDIRRRIEQRFLSQ